MLTIARSITIPFNQKTKRSTYIDAAVLISWVVFVFAASGRVFAQNPFSLPQGHDGEAYSYQLNFEGGTSPVTWSLKSGKLPPGVTLDPKSGVLSGSPLPGEPRPMTYAFEIQAEDSALHSGKAIQSFTLTIDTNKPLVIVVPTPTPIPAPTPPFVLATSTSDEETISLTQEVKPDDIHGVTQATLAISDPNTLINTTIESDVNAKFKVGDYCVVHLIRWKPLKEGKSDPEKESWALLERVNKNGNEIWERRFDPKDKDGLTYVNRIFGSKRVIALLIHYNTPPTWDIKYKVSITQQTPTPIADVLALAGSFAPHAFRVGSENTRTIWGARLMLVNYTASQLVVKVNTVTSNDRGTPVEQSKEITKSFTNEGRYRWDVSVGVPVTTIRELQFSTDSNNRVTTGGKDRQNVYGFLNLFLKPVDLSSESFPTVPHLVFGVPLASKPLHHPFAGIGYGVYKSPIKFNLFAGIVFNRERVPRTLNVGNTATSSQLESDLHTRWVRKFMFGINFPIKQITDAIKSKK